jgi:RNA polymerase sigma-70 factor, ECF subfamily
MKTFDSSQEAQWIENALRGNDDAFSSLVERYQGPVFNLCYRMLGDRPEAEDAAQESFLKAYHALGRYDQKRKFVNWMLSIASNHCVDRLRKRRHIVFSLDEGFTSNTLPHPGLGPEASFVVREQQASIQHLIGRLKPKDRAVIVLRFWHDMSYDEISDTTGLSLSAVKSRLHRARLELAKLFTDDQSQPALVGRRQDEPSTL